MKMKHRCYWWRQSGADRKVTHEQIEKYLNGPARGIVTNGYVWVLCAGGKHRAVTLYVDKVDMNALADIVGFIRGEPLDHFEPASESATYSAGVRPLVARKRTKASRPMHETHAVHSSAGFSAFISTLEKSPPNEQALLTGIADALAESSYPEYLRIEARKTRISFFSERQRLARIELGKLQPDVLVLTSIVGQHPSLGDLATPTIHDKGAHMRRFRLGEKNQCQSFGASLVEALRT